MVSTVQNFAVAAVNDVQTHRDTYERLTSAALAMVRQLDPACQVKARRLVRDDRGDSGGELQVWCSGQKRIVMQVALRADLVGLDGGAPVQTCEAAVSYLGRVIRMAMQG